MQGIRRKCKFGFQSLNIDRISYSPHACSNHRLNFAISITDMIITPSHFSLSQKMTALVLFNERSLQLLKDLVTRQKILGQPIGQVTRQRNGITDKNNQTKNAFTRKALLWVLVSRHTCVFYLNPVTFSPQVARPPTSCAKSTK